MFGDMSQSDQSVSAYQLHIVLGRTSPHLWRRVLVRSDSTLHQLHQTIQALFGWSDTHPHRFVFRGRFLGASPAAAISSLPAADLPLAELQLQLKEKFFYHYRFHDPHTPVWRHQLRLEKILVADRDAYPTCLGGVGSPPLEDTHSPRELTDLTELFTPQFVLHRLTALIDQQATDAQLAQELRYLRPWLTADRFRRPPTERRLRASLGGAQ